MFGPRLIRTMATAAFVTGVLTAGEIRAQATLGFTIDPTQGLPGTTVNGQVDVADIDASCVTDLTAFHDRFQAQFDGPFVGADSVGELPQRFFPDPMNLVYENMDQMAYVLTLAALLGISADLGGATETAFQQSFAMTFADLATQQPVGDLGTFDPTTGEGSVVTPDVEPGPWAVAAACVGPIFDIDTLEANIRQQTSPFLTSIGVQFGPDGIFSPEFSAFMQQYLNTDLEGLDLLIAFVSAIGPHLIQPIVTPDALGVQIFTVLAPPPQAIENVIDDVQDLVAAGDLKKGQGKALTSILQNALASVERGNTEAACGQLGAFENAAAAMNGAATGGVIDQVETIRGQLGCTPAGSPSGAFVDGDAMH